MIVPSDIFIEVKNKILTSLHNQFEGCCYEDIGRNYQVCGCWTFSWKKTA